MTRQVITDILRQPNFHGDLKAAAFEDTSQDDDEDDSQLDLDGYYMAGRASEGPQGSCAQRLATARATRSPPTIVEVQYEMDDARRQRLRDNISIFDDTRRTPDPDTCQLEPSQLAIDAFHSPSGSATHHRGVGSLSVKVHAHARVLDLAVGIDDALDFFDSATNGREPFVLFGDREEARAQCHWHKLATVRLQAATRGTIMILVVSVTIGGARYHTLFYDNELVRLDDVILATRAKIASSWSYPKAQQSERRRRDLAQSLPAKIAGAVHANAEIEAGVPVQRPSRFQEMKAAETAAQSTGSVVTSESRVQLPRPYSDLLLSDEGPVPLTRRHTHHATRFTYAMLAAAPVDTEVSMSTRADTRDIDGIPHGPAFVEFIAIRHSSPRKHVDWMRSLGVETVELRGMMGSGYKDFEALLRSRVAKNVFTAFFIMQLADREAHTYSGAVLVHVQEGTWCVSLGYAASTTPPSPSARTILSSLDSGCTTRFGIKLRAEAPSEGSLRDTFDFTARLRRGPPSDADIEQLYPSLLGILEKSPALFANAEDDHIVAEACGTVFGVVAAHAARFCSILRTRSTDKYSTKPALPGRADYVASAEALIKDGVKPRRTGPEPPTLSRRKRPRHRAGPST